MRILLALLFALTLASCGTDDTKQYPGPIVEPSARRGSGTLRFTRDTLPAIAIKGFTTFQYVGQIVVSDSAEQDRRILLLLPGNRLPRTTRTYTLVDGDSTPKATQARFLVSDFSDGQSLDFKSTGGQQVTLTVDGKKVSGTVTGIAMRPNLTLNPVAYRVPGTLSATFTFIAQDDMFE